MKGTNWKQEAQKQAADAGELKMKLAERLEHIRTEISTARQYLRFEDNNLDRVVLEWKLGQLQKEEEWLEGILYGHREQNSAADC